MARSTKSFEVSLFSEFAKQVVAHNPDIAESGKPMEEQKFTEEKYAIPAKIANLSVAVANCQSLHFDFTFEIIAGSWNRRPGPPSPNYSPTF